MFEGGGLGTGEELPILDASTKDNSVNLRDMQVILMIWKWRPENPHKHVRNPTLNTRNFSHVNINMTFGFRWSTLNMSQCFCHLYSGIWNFLYLLRFIYLCIYWYSFAMLFDFCDKNSLTSWSMKFLEREDDLPSATLQALAYNSRIFFLRLWICRQQRNTSGLVTIRWKLYFS